jgi:membrane protease YdiL (CAAX protease family)
LRTTEPSAGLRAILRLAAGELDRPTAVLLILAATMPVVYVYQGTPEFYLSLCSPGGRNGVTAELYRFGAVFVLFFVVPALCYRLLARRPLAELGFRLGDLRAGLTIVLAALAALTPVLWLVSFDPAMQREYPLAKQATASVGLLVAYELAYGLYYWGWEFLFRGALQLGLRPRLGLVGACAVQLLPSVLLHIGKPVGETWAAVVAAPAFGLMAVRTGSFLPLFLVHWGIGVLNDVFCSWRQGLLSPLARR